MEQRAATPTRLFYRLTLSTVVAVYLLIFVGGVVRSTGSGMGCPDWPKCFGNWVPPASVEELPANYKEVYSSFRDRKNQRFAKYLEAVGLKEAAAGILTDESIRKAADFNVVKTWIEYVNRLIGVIIGFLIFAVFVASLRYRKSRRNITLTAFFSLVLVGFQGWIGSVVVSTNLTPWTITLHMFLALLIVALLIYVVHQSKEPVTWSTRPSYFMVLVLACIVALLIQTLFGTQVREVIDQLSASLPRQAWISNAGEAFTLHRSFSWVVLVLHVALIFNLYKIAEVKRLRTFLLLIISITFLSGLGMAYFSVPAALQPVHLLMATAAFGIQVFLLLQAKDSRQRLVAA